MQTAKCYNFCLRHSVHSFKNHYESHLHKCGVGIILYNICLRYWCSSSHIFHSLSLQKVGTRQLCPMCQTSHQLSDMIENKNDEGRLEFFCSNRCMMVYEAQTFTVTGISSHISNCRESVLYCAALNFAVGQQFLSF